MTEHDFKFYQSEWTRYKRVTKVAGQDLIDELWTTMQQVRVSKRAPLMLVRQC